MYPVQKENQVPYQGQVHEIDQQSLHYLHRQPRPAEKFSHTYKHYIEPVEEPVCKTMETVSFNYGKVVLIG